MPTKKKGAYDVVPPTREAPERADSSAILAQITSVTTKAVAPVKAEVDEANRKAGYHDQVINVILIATTLTFITLLFDALMFHIEYSKDNAQVIEHEIRLRELQFQNRLLQKKHPELFEDVYQLEL